MMSLHTGKPMMRKEFAHQYLVLFTYASPDRKIGCLPIPLQRELLHPRFPSQIKYEHEQRPLFVNVKGTDRCQSPLGRCWETDWAYIGNINLKQLKTLTSGGDSRESLKQAFDGVVTPNYNLQHRVEQDFSSKVIVKTSKAVQV